MKFHHGDVEFEIDDQWWFEAEMVGFHAHSAAFVPGPSHRQGSVREVAVAAIEPVRRSLSHGVFNDDSLSGSGARNRVVSLLRAFREGTPVPPVEILIAPPNQPDKYRLYHGVHRLYCSVAVGFTHVPAVEVGHCDA